MALTSFDDAIDIIKQNTKSLNTEILSIYDALNRVTSKDILAKITQQPFNNSAVDGIGITKDTLNKLLSDNFELKIKHTILAGDIPDNNLQLSENECLHIMTGAIVPDFITTMFFIEQTTKIAEDTILINAPLSDHQNIRKSGEDYKFGDVLITANTKLNVNNLSLLASSGIAELEVFKKPKIAIFTTGRETKSVNETLNTGEIYNSNIITMSTFLQSLNCEVVALENVNDNIESLEKNIIQAKKLGCDVIVSSGAVSMGIEDIVKHYLQENAKVLYNGLKIRPGKPNMLAEIEGMLYFGLPGNPVSATIGLYMFVQAYYNFANGLTANPTKAILKNSFTKKSGFTFFARGLKTYNNTIVEVEILPKQGSHILSTTSHANVYVKLPEESSEIIPNTIVEVYDV